MSGFASPIDDSIRQNAIEEFQHTWQEYSSASAAAKAIAVTWGIGRTTLTEWLQDENLWPSATIKQVQRLQREVQRLKKRNKFLEEQLDNVRGVGRLYG